MNKNTLNLRIDEVVCVGRAKKLLGGGGGKWIFSKKSYCTCEVGCCSDVFLAGHYGHYKIPKSCFGFRPKGQSTLFGMSVGDDSMFLSLV